MQVLLDFLEKETHHTFKEALHIAGHEGGTIEFTVDWAAAR